MDDFYEEDVYERKVQRNNTNTGGGVVRIILIVALCWWGYNHFVKKDYSKPWWSGVGIQNVCVIHVVGNLNCYSLSVSAEGKKVMSLTLPGGQYNAVVSTECGYVSEINERYCEIVDSKGNEWEVRNTSRVNNK